MGVMIRSPEVIMPRLSHLVIVGLLLLAALGLETARPLAWGGAEAADGTRYKVSPLGISHVLRPRQPVSPTRDCRWSPPDGDEALCAVGTGGEAAFRSLRFVPHVLNVAIALCLVTGVLVFARRPALAALRTLTAGAAVLAALGAPALFALAVPRALAVLQGLPFGVGGTRGTLQVAVVAAVLAGLAAASLMRSAGGRSVVRRWLRWAGGAALVSLSVLGFLAMFPPLGGLAFATASISIGVGVGWWGFGDCHPSSLLARGAA
jgi:hypothetical protein